MTDHFMSPDEWRDEAIKRFGNDPWDWRFVCPVFKTEQGMREFAEKTGLTPDEIVNVIGFSCVGRWTNDVGCDYAGGGLLRLNPVKVETDGMILQRFSFADVTPLPDATLAGDTTET